MNLPLYMRKHMLAPSPFSVNCHRMFSRVRWGCWAVQWPKGHLSLSQGPINFLLEAYVLEWVVLVTESPSIPHGFFFQDLNSVEAKDRRGLLSKTVFCCQSFPKL